MSEALLSLRGRFGDITNKGIFREEILVEFSEKSVRYVYFWGMPGGDFAERSGCLMNLIEA